MNQPMFKGSAETPFQIDWFLSSMIMIMFLFFDILLIGILRG